MTLMTPWLTTHVSKPSGLGQGHIPEEGRSLSENPVQSSKLGLNRLVHFSSSEEFSTVT